MKSWKIRSVALLAMLLFIWGMVAGCGPKPSGNGGGGGKTEIRWGIYADPARLNISESLAAEFEKRNPDIKVKVEAVPFAQYYEKLGTQVSAGTAYDVMMISGAYFSKLAPQGAFLDLTDRVKAAGINLSDYTIEKANSEYDGKLYALPWELDIQALWYNKDLFDAAKVAYPTADWTWDDLLAAAQKLTKKDASGKVVQWGFYSDNMYPSWVSFIGQSGGSIFDSSGKGAAINSPEAIRAIQFMTDLIHKYKVAPAPGQLPQGVNPFHTGKVAMALDGSYSVPPALKLSFKWDVAPLPAGQKKAAAYWTQGLAIYSRTKNPDAAWKLVQFLVSKEGQELFAKTHMATPSLKSVALSDAYLSGVSQNLKVFVDSYAFGQPVPFNEKFFEIFRGPNSAIEKPFGAAWRGQISAAEAVKQAAENINKVMAQ